MAIFLETFILLRRVRALILDTLYMRRKAIHFFLKCSIEQREARKMFWNSSELPHVSVIKLLIELIAFYCIIIDEYSFFICCINNFKFNFSWDCYRKKIKQINENERINKWVFCNISTEKSLENLSALKVVFMKKNRKPLAVPSGAKRKNLYVWAMRREIHSLNLLAYSHLAANMQ